MIFKEKSAGGQLGKKRDSFSSTVVVDVIPSCIHEGGQFEDQADILAMAEQKCGNNLCP